MTLFRISRVRVLRTGCTPYLIIYLRATPSDQRHSKALFAPACMYIQYFLIASQLLSSSALLSFSAPLLGFSALQLFPSLLHGYLSALA